VAWVVTVADTQAIPEEVHKSTSNKGSTGDGLDNHLFTRSSSVRVPQRPKPKTPRLYTFT
jgi:hypothetical protein